MAHLEQIFTWSGFFAWSCEDAAMNDKTLKCITMMSHEIKAIHSGALCEKYGNNIALGKQNSPPPPAYEICDKGSFLKRDETPGRVFKFFAAVRSEYQWPRYEPGTQF